MVLLVEAVGGLNTPILVENFLESVVMVVVVVVVVTVVGDDRVTKEDENA